MRTYIVLLMTMLFVTGCTTPHRYVVELCPSLCGDEICVIDNLYELSKSDIDQLLVISKEYESDKHNYTNINLEVLSEKKRFKVHAFKCDYYGVEILVEKTNDLWKKISAKEFIF